MSKTQHTPGPWTACFSRQCNVAMGFHITGEKEGSINPVCEYVRPTIKGVDAHPSSVLEANAHLLSAAPELLASCIAMMGYMEEGFLVRDTSDDANRDWPLRALSFVKDIKAMHAAVSKAEGRS